MGGPVACQDGVGKTRKVQPSVCTLQQLLKRGTEAASARLRGDSLAVTSSLPFLATSRVRHGPNDGCVFGMPLAPSGQD
jgi:hypothetical protein